MSLCGPAIVLTILGDSADPAIFSCRTLWPWLFDPAQYAAFKRETVNPHLIVVMLEIINKHFIWHAKIKQFFNFIFIQC